MSAAGTVLAVDQNSRNLELLAQVLVAAGYRVRTASSLEQFDEALKTTGDIGLGLIDLSGFDTRIWERCQRLRSQDIPFLILSTRQSTALQQASLAHGARGVVAKPLSIRDLLGLAEGHWRRNP